jgi:hypothetical protein
MKRRSSIKGDLSSVGAWTSANSDDGTIVRVRSDQRQDAGASRKAGTGRALALIPLSVAVVLAALMLPRSAVPSLLPVPELDQRAIEREVRADRERAERSRAKLLPAEVRSLGAAVRHFNTREADNERDVELTDARAEIDRARLLLIGRGLEEEVIALRAVQLDGFLVEVERFERTGEISPELKALGGTFVARMRRVGWCEGHHLVLTDLERRAAFKATWNKLVDLDKDSIFALSNQETRALYTLYFTHPHASEAQRAALALARAQARDKETCARIDDGEHAATEAWLLPKLGEYGTLDPEYPLAFARGVVLYQRHQYADAARSFTQWLDAHPDGPWTLRARNHLRASMAAEENSF